jgi:transcription antitermination factor NusG
MSARDDSYPYGGAISDDLGWMVLQAKRHKERAVQVNLSREGIATYLPLLRQWPRPAVGGEVGPMFPGYVFCQPAPGQLSAVTSCSGAVRLVTFGDGPARVGAEVVAYLRSRAGVDGIIEIDPELAGREVTITDGPLRGLAAVVERRLTARQRVLVLLTLLHRQTRVELPERWLRLA